MANTTEHSEWRKTDGLLGYDGFCRSSFAGGAPFAREYFGRSEDFSLGGDIVSTTAYAGWSVTPVGASTLVMGDVLGGQLQLVSSAVENEGIQMQTDGEFFLPAALNDIWFEAQISGNDVTQDDWFVGICTTDPTIVAGNPDDVIGFWTHDGDANLDFEVSANLGAGAPVDTLIDLTDNTPIRVGFHVQGLTKVTPYINGVANATATSITVANIPAVELAPAFANLNGEGVANSLYIDWFRWVQLSTA